ncbi:MAG: thioredoxin-related protein [bacterium]|jgi:thioredoxin-related protein
MITKRYQMKFLIMRYACLIALLLFVGRVAFGVNFETNIDSAKTEAAKNNKTILMVFAGSDWCSPCIKFKNDILLSDAFVQYAKDKLVVLYLDFPAQKKNKLSAELTTQNELLAEKYNRNGVFPKILVFRADETQLGEVSYSTQSPEKFIESCSGLMPSSNTETLYPAKKQVLLMDCKFEITAVATSEEIAWESVNVGIAEIQRIESLISSWDDRSQTS